jgi:hypothetical protein
MDERKNIFENLKRAIDNLEKMGIELDNPPPGQHRKLIGQIIVDGRAITNVLQNLRGKVQNFDKWYAPYVFEMQNDELLRFFYKVRSDILKKGDDHIEKRSGRIDSRRHFMSISDKGIEIQMLKPNGRYLHEVIPKPTNAKSAFMLDSEGGCGWIVEKENGTETKQYVRVPNGMCIATFKFRQAPITHLGKDISILHGEEMCKLYIIYLSAMVRDALNKFAQD